MNCPSPTLTSRKCRLRTSSGRYLRAEFMRRAFFILFLALAFSAAAQTNSFDPESAYTPRDIEGWRILVNGKLLAETNLCDRVMKILSAQLFQITRVVPAPALA